MYEILASMVVIVCHNNEDDLEKMCVQFNCLSCLIFVTYHHLIKVSISDCLLSIIDYVCVISVYYSLET